MRRMSSLSPNDSCSTSTPGWGPAPVDGRNSSASSVPPSASGTASLAPVGSIAHTITGPSPAGHAPSPTSKTSGLRHTVGVDSLFDPADTATSSDPPAGAPLAARMRPATLAEFVGQEHLLGVGGGRSSLRTAIEQGTPHSMILHGPPGSGKTTLARIVAASASAAFEELSAVEAGRPEVRAVLARARERKLGGRDTIFFLDEIHRFNKAQQDALLPAVEEGLVTLIGATTENPAFEVNGALLSRLRVYALQALAPADVVTLLRRAAEALERPTPAGDHERPAMRSDEQRATGH